VGHAPFVDDDLRRGGETRNLHDAHGKNSLLESIESIIAQQYQTLPLTLSLSKGRRVKEASEFAYPSTSSG
jgi:hypothetical protein